MTDINISDTLAKDSLKADINISNGNKSTVSSNEFVATSSSSTSIHPRLDLQNSDQIKPTSTNAKKINNKKPKKETKAKPQLETFFQNNNNNFHQLSSYKKQIYNELQMQPGISRQEILIELESDDFVESMTTSDDVLIAIVSKRQDIENSHSSTLMNADMLREQENQMLDQALLISEGERENISSRKRKRKEDLSSSCTVHISDAEEFSNSVLIHSHPPNDSSTSNDIAVFTALIQKLEQSNCHTTEHLATSDSNQICFCCEIKKQCRRAIVNLLYLEKDSIKFHKSHCEKYFQKLKLSITKEFTSVLPNLITEITSNNLTTSINCQKLLDYLNNEIKVLEDSLYRNTLDDGNCIPYIFRQCDPDNHFFREYDISNDGFEIVTPVNSTKSEIINSKNSSNSKNNDENCDD